MRKLGWRIFFALLLFRNFKMLGGSVIQMTDNHLSHELSILACQIYERNDLICIFRLWNDNDLSLKLQRPLKKLKINYTESKFRAINFEFIHHVNTFDVY